MKKTRWYWIATVFFMLVAIADVYAVITANKSVEMLCKPLLMTTLVTVYLTAVNKPNFWFVSGLFFSFWGDVFLLDKEQFFVFGLGSFLLAHFIYIKITVSFLEKELTSKMISSSIPFVLLFAGLLLLIYDNLGEMLVPVIVYGLTIATFGSCAFLLYRQQPSKEHAWLFLGAVIFIASDSLIALNNFYSPKHLFDIAIIVLYIIAQYYITRAMIAKR